MGQYGRTETWEDARTTVTELLDNFYDDSTGGTYDQAFLELERRLKQYFNYEKRGE